MEDLAKGGVLGSCYNINFQGKSLGLELITPKIRTCGILLSRLIDEYKFSGSLLTKQHSLGDWFINITSNEGLCVIYVREDNDSNV